MEYANYVIHCRANVLDLDAADVAQSLRDSGIDCDGFEHVPAVMLAGGKAPWAVRFFCVHPVALEQNFRAIAGIVAGQFPPIFDVQIHRLDADEE